MERLNPRNEARAKMRFLQILEDLGTSQEDGRPIIYPPVTPQPHDRSRSVMPEQWEARHPPFASNYIQPYHGSIGGPTAEQDLHYEHL